MSALASRLAALIILAWAGIAWAQVELYTAPPWNPRPSVACERPDWDPRRNDYDDPCLTALAFDPALYFDDWGREPDPIQPDGIVDAVHISGLHGVAWAFAISHRCPGEVRVREDCPFEQRRLLLRAITWKRIEEMPPGWRYEPPKSRADVVALLPQVVRWREADLTVCPGALDTLRSLEQVRWMAFDAYTSDLLAGRDPRDDPEAGVLIMDSPSTLVRTGDFYWATASRNSGGEGGPADWAGRMMEVAEPCLKPTSAAPPWTRRTAEPDD